MVKVPAKVQRIVSNPAGFPVTETLSSVGGALHWTGALKEAHVFDDIADAEAATKIHGGFPFVVSRPERKPRPEPEIPAEEVSTRKPRSEMTIEERVRENRAARKKWQKVAPDPAEVFERMERRHEA